MEQDASVRRANVLINHFQTPEQPSTQVVQIAGTQQYDVIIIGGGVAGSSTADELSRRGKKVLLLEQFHETHSRASSFGDGRIIRYAYPESVYLEMARMSYEGWKELERRAGVKLMQYCGGVDIAGKENHNYLQDLETNYKKHGVKYKYLSKEEAAQLCPQFTFPKDLVDKLLYQPDYGVLYASQAVSAYWKQARAQGATILTNSKVVDIVVESATSVKVQTENGGLYVGKNLVLAAGPYTKSLAKKLSLDLPLTISQEMLLYFAPKPGNKLDYTDKKMPVLIDHNQLKIYLLPQIDVPGVKIGMHHDPTAPIITDPDTRKSPPEETQKKIKQWVSEHLPGLDPNPIGLATCLYTNTPDYHFIIDTHPKYRNVVICSPCSGHGFKFGPVYGKINAALLEGKQVEGLDLSLFRIDRQVLTKRTGF